MKNTIIVIGLGELGSVFARGFLKLGYPVQGVTRDMDMQALSQEVSNPEAVLVSVGEADIHSTLDALPEVWKNNVILLQNELLPMPALYGETAPSTVISVWFEKKKGMDSKVVLPSAFYGQHANLARTASTAAPSRWSSVT